MRQDYVYATGKSLRGRDVREEALSAAFVSLKESWIQKSTQWVTHGDNGLRSNQFRTH